VVCPHCARHKLQYREGKGKISEFPPLTYPSCASLPIFVSQFCNHRSGLTFYDSLCTPFSLYTKRFFGQKLLLSVSLNLARVSWKTFCFDINVFTNKTCTVNSTSAHALWILYRKKENTFIWTLIKENKNTI
jgi:hypothetical protein